MNDAAVTKLALFGAGSSLGVALTTELLKRGYEVVALVDDLEGFAVRPGLRIQLGDPMNAEHVHHGVIGASAVICLLEPATHLSGSPAPQVAAAKALLEGLGQSGIKRLVLVGDVDVHLDVPAPATHAAALSAAETSAIIVEALRRSPLDWTLVSNPQGVDGLSIEDFQRSGEAGQTARDQAIHRLHRVATGIADELKLNEHIRQYVNFVV